MKGTLIESFEDDEDRDHIRVNAFEVTYTGFAQGLRLIFPHALERDLEALWSACGGTTNGRLAYQELMDKVMYRVPDRRCRSPEPGPTHYNPQFDLTSPRAPAAVVLPQVAEPDIVAGLPSELFIDYDHAYKAVKPSTSGLTFRKRKFNTSWCNPVSKEEAMAVRGDKSPESVTNKTAKPPQPPPPIVEGATEHPVISEEAASSLMPESFVAPKGLKGTLVNTASMPLKSSLGTDLSEMAHRVNVASTAALQSGSNLFYNDIAPIYLKFLRSKEIQKLMKNEEDAANPNTRPTTRNGLEKR